MADRYGFSQADSKRIGRSVRVVERLGALSETSGPEQGEVSRGVRLLIAKHESTAGWAKETTAVVTVYNGDPIASAMTMVASNQFLTFSTTTACTQRWVALGHNGWGWYAVAQEKACEETCSMEVSGVDFSTVQGYQSTATQMLGHAEGCIKWFDITTCSTSTAA